MLPECLEEKELIKQVHEVINSLEIPSEFHEFAMKWFKSQNKKQYEVINKSVESQNKSYMDCVNRLENLAYMRANSEITPQEYSVMKAKELELKGQLERSRGDTGHTIDKWVETGDEMLTFIDKVREKFNNGGYDVKRRILSTLGSNLIMKDRKVFVDLENSLFPMQTVSKEVKLVNEAVRTSNNLATKQDFEAAYEGSSRLLRDLESNQNFRFQRATSYL